MRVCEGRSDGRTMIFRVQAFIGPGILIAAAQLLWRCQDKLLSGRITGASIFLERHQSPLHGLRRRALCQPAPQVPPP
jgi:hypothetical protein